MSVVPIKVVNRGPNPLPTYALRGDAGVDVRAAKTVTITPGETTLVPTGLYVAIPPGYELQARPRSGLSLRSDLRIPNSPGTIDSNYRGEIQIIMQHTGFNEEIVIKEGERIAQLVLNRVPTILWDELDTLPDSDRGDAGFGSTGVK